MSVFSLYVHIPYCQAKCPYCDFNSHAATRWPEERYTAALCTELQCYAASPAWAGNEIQTIFFGGGTPSLFAPASIRKILRQAGESWTLAPGVETTLEANPGTVSLEKLCGFREAGVNRMSFGVQSFAAHHLRTLGRIHDAESAKAAIGLARRAGFEAVSLDLIFALPEQRLDEWESDLQQACALDPDHLSAYNLTYEAGTPFHRWKAEGKLGQLPEEIEVAMFTRTGEVLGAAGYRHYEISNYARPGHECRHNLNYWHSGSYLGVGAGAHGFEAPPGRARSAGTEDGGGLGGDDGCGGWGRRWGNEAQPARYLEAIEHRGHARVAEERLAEQQARGEFVFLGLRCRAGFPGAAFEERFGVPLPTAFPHVDELCGAGLLQCSGGAWQLTPRGVLLGDSVFATFL
jgi:oxygen-independent coproporphyrinogen-3 oxidase